MSSDDPYALLTVAEFTSRLASAEPVPGGGSASAVAGALAAALVVMVSRLSQNRPTYALYTPTLALAEDSGERARRRLLELADLDAAAYAAYGAARRMPRETPAQEAARATEVRAAARRAADVPLEILRECRDVLRLAESLAGRSNLNASSDLDVAASLARAAGHGAGANVLINLASAGDVQYAEAAKSQVEGLLGEIEQAAHDVNAEVARGQLREPAA